MVGDMQDLVGHPEPRDRGERVGGGNELDRLAHVEDARADAQPVRGGHQHAEIATEGPGVVTRQVTEDVLSRDTEGNDVLDAVGARDEEVIVTGGHRRSHPQRTVEGRHPHVDDARPQADGVLPLGDGQGHPAEVIGDVRNIDHAKVPHLGVLEQGQPRGVPGERVHVVGHGGKGTAHALAAGTAVDA